MAFNKMKKALTPKASPAQKKKVGKVMGEFKEGTLKTPAGKPITDRKQGVAVALSEAGLSNKSKQKKSY